MSDYIRHPVFLVAGGACLGVAAHALWERIHEPLDLVSNEATLSPPELDGPNTSPALPERSQTIEPPAKGLDLTSPRKSSNCTAAWTRDDLREIFSSLAGADDLIQFEEFQSALTERIKLSLTREEITRVWSNLVKPSNCPDKAHLSEQDVLNADVDFETFCEGVKNLSFLKSCVQNLKQPPAFTVPANYDYTKSTEENYKTSDTTSYGDFKAVRETVDYSYHVHYTKERQQWQDAVIKTVVSRTAPQATPWVVYTCGAMGAGKGFTLGWMSRNGYFPLEDIVAVDPDHFKSIMPEWEGYAKLGGEAGSLCHKESGFLQEIAQEIAMQNHQNVWVDGSLRDGHWFAKLFREMRSRFPHYKIAIFEVNAPEEIVRQRIKSRALATGRDVPEHLIVQSLSSVSRSLDMLTPLVDFVARVDNGGNAPQLRAFIRVSRDGNWGHISHRFARPRDSGTFPCALAPLLLVKVDGLECITGVKQTENQLHFDRDHEDLKDVKNALQSSCMELSPPCNVTLGQEARKAAGIPATATDFCFVYPADVDWNLVTVAATSLKPVTLLTLVGGFVYYDDKGQVCGINSVKSFLGAEEAAGTTDPILQFQEPEPMFESTYQFLKRANRFKPITLGFLLEKGAIAFAWIKPGEALPGREAKSGGAFVYLFSHGKLKEGLKGMPLNGFKGYFHNRVHEGVLFPVATGSFEG